MSALRRFAQPFVLAAMMLVAIAFAGHVCALPVTGHANLAGPAPASEGAAGHEADGAHLASCDATLSKISQASPVPSAPSVSARATSLLPPASSADAGAVREASSAGSRPPLFLLHATFRI